MKLKVSWCFYGWRILYIITTRYCHWLILESDWQRSNFAQALTFWGHTATRRVWRGTYYCKVAFELISIKFLEIKKLRGAILERWDGIDGYLCKNLLQDPRFPSMPTYLSYTPTFSEPINWGDNYGSRIRGYFVPQETGPHIFFIGEKTNGIGTPNLFKILQKSTNFLDNFGYQDLILTFFVNQLVISRWNCVHNRTTLIPDVRCFKNRIGNSIIGF